MADYFEETQGFAFVCFADEFEDVAQEVAVVGEFVGCAFCGDAAALVEGFVEDADSLEGAAVFAGWGARALSKKGTVSMIYCVDLRRVCRFVDRLDQPSAWTSCTQDKQ